MAIEIKEFDDGFFCGGCGKKGKSIKELFTHIWEEHGESALLKNVIFSPVPRDVFFSSQIYL